MTFSYRFIPARAGNATAEEIARFEAQVHPRACGERVKLSADDWKLIGSSPRVRGTRASNALGSIRRRFIPARAGNAREWSAARQKLPVHPRACGERGLTTVDGSGSPGSSPRVRGTPDTAGYVPQQIRFIPARAGNACRLPAIGCGLPVHPRACGERHAGGGFGPKDCGSSPRVRGTRLRRRAVLRLARFIPARAGNARPSGSAVTAVPVHPRACGEREFDGVVGGKVSGSSPRVRGTLIASLVEANWRRFIPARAGNARPSGSAVIAVPVHPRACGERPRAN